MTALRDGDRCGTWKTAAEDRAHDPEACQPRQASRHETRMGGGVQRRCRPRSRDCVRSHDAIAIAPLLIMPSPPQQGFRGVVTTRAHETCPNC